MRLRRVKVRSLGAGETSFQGRHEHATFVTDLDENVVLHVAGNRKRVSIDAFSLKTSRAWALKETAMCLWRFLRTTQAGSESVNSAVQRVKRAAGGFRKRKRFRNAILFHLGGLDLHPAHASCHPRELPMRLLILRIVFADLVRP